MIAARRIGLSKGHFEGFTILLLLVCLAGTSWATEPGDISEEEEFGAQPPPITAHYIQYGVALVAHSSASAGDVCPQGSEVPCILGSGGGLAIRLGYQSRGAWYVGGAYEFSRQDSSNLIRLPILQQLRAEVRHQFSRERRLAPYLWGGLGAVVYGNEWGAQTGGLAPALGAGARFQLSRTSQVGASLSYRPLLLRRWTDSAGQRRADRFLGFGLAHLISVELIFEVSNPLPRW